MLRLRLYFTSSEHAGRCGVWPDITESCRMERSFAISRVNFSQGDESVRIERRLWMIYGGGLKVVVDSTGLESLANFDRWTIPKKRRWADEVTTLRSAKTSTAQGTAILA